MNAEQEDHARTALTGAGIIGDAQNTAVSNLVGMTEGWAPATGTRPGFVPLRSQDPRG